MNQEDIMLSKISKNQYDNRHRILWKLKVLLGSRHCVSVLIRETDSIQDIQTYKNLHIWLTVASCSVRCKKLQRAKCALESWKIHYKAWYSLKCPMQVYIRRLKSMHLKAEGSMLEGE